jgi:MerR family copper efflux transcriptional regulator
MNIEATTPLTIGRLAGRANVSVDTVRFYERRGLLPEPARTPAGYRVYAVDTVARLQFIRRAKNLGFSLDEIAILLKLQDSGGRKSEVKELTHHKLEKIKAKIDDLMRIRKVLTQLSKECTGSGDIAGCPIIEALATEENSL